MGPRDRGSASTATGGARDVRDRERLPGQRARDVRPRRGCARRPGRPGRDDPRVQVRHPASLPGAPAGPLPDLLRLARGAQRAPAAREGRHSLRAFRRPAGGRGAGGADDLQVRVGRRALRRCQGGPRDPSRRLHGGRARADHAALHAGARRSRLHQSEPGRARARHRHRRARDGLDGGRVPAALSLGHRRAGLRHGQARDPGRHSGTRGGDRPRGPVRPPRVLPPPGRRGPQRPGRRPRRQAGHPPGARQRGLSRGPIPHRGGRRAPHGRHRARRRPSLR